MAHRQRRRRRRALKKPLEINLSESFSSIAGVEQLSHRRGGPTHKKCYGPRPSSRNIEVCNIEELPGGILVFTVRSYSPKVGISLNSGGQKWHPSYDQETGLVWCDCYRALYDIDPLVEALNHWPTILTSTYHCKHLRHLIGVLWRSGRIRAIALARALWFEQTYGAEADGLAANTASGRRAP